MDYGYLGFIIHKIHNLWIFNGFGISHKKHGSFHGFEIDIRYPYGFGLGLDSWTCRNWIMDWIWIIIWIHPAPLDIDYKYAIRFHRLTITSLLPMSNI